MKIGLIGKMGSGKSTAAQYLVNKHKFIKLSFADPVKVVTAQMLNHMSSYLHVYGVADHEYRHWTLSDVDEAKKEPVIRQMLQFVGTELGREFLGYDRVWIDILLRDAEHLDNVVVDDVRFLNEAQALRDNGFKLIRIQQDTDEDHPAHYHKSETELDDFVADSTYVNKWDKETMYAYLDQIMKHLSQENTRLQ